MNFSTEVYCRHHEMAKLNLALWSGSYSCLHTVFRKTLWAPPYVLAACAHSSNSIFTIFGISTVLLIFHLVAFCPSIAAKLYAVYTRAYTSLANHMPYIHDVYTASCAWIRAFSWYHLYFKQINTYRKLWENAMLIWKIPRS